MDPNSSEPITALYPTQYEWLRKCPLHVAFDQQRRATGERRRKSDPQRMGDVVHDTMRRLVRSGALQGEDWRAAVDASWAEAVAQEAAKDPDGRDPARWADYEEKRQRTTRLASRVRALVLEHGPSGFLAEERLEGRGGKLKGIADLVIRTDTLRAVIDYKTGAVGTEDGHPVKGEYDRQLRLYAALEAEAGGARPSLAAVYPLAGPVIEVDASAESCDQAAADALAALEAYIAAVPGPQEAKPGAESCRRCDFASSCEVFWSTPVEGITAAQGTVTEVFLAGSGGVSVAIEEADGSRIEILTISPALHPSAGFVKPGDSARFVGLQPAHDAGFYRLPATGLMGVTRAGELRGRSNGASPS